MYSTNITRLSIAKFVPKDPEDCYEYLVDLYQDFFPDTDHKTPFQVSADGKTWSKLESSFALTKLVDAVISDGGELKVRQLEGQEDTHKQKKRNSVVDGVGQIVYTIVDSAVEKVGGAKSSDSQKSVAFESEGSEGRHSRQGSVGSLDVAEVVQIQGRLRKLDMNSSDLTWGVRDYKEEKVEVTWGADSSISIPEDSAVEEVDQVSVFDSTKTEVGDDEVGSTNNDEWGSTTASRSRASSASANDSIPSFEREGVQELRSREPVSPENESWKQSRTRKEDPSSGWGAATTNVQDVDNGWGNSETPTAVPTLDLSGWSSLPPPGSISVKDHSQTTSIDSWIENSSRAENVWEEPWEDKKTDSNSSSAAAPPPTVVIPTISVEAGGKTRSMSNASNTNKSVSNVSTGKSGWDKPPSRTSNGDEWNSAGGDESKSKSWTDYKGPTSDRSSIRDSGAYNDRQNGSSSRYNDYGREDRQDRGGRSPDRNDRTEEDYLGRSNRDRPPRFEGDRPKPTPKHVREEAPETELFRSGVQAGINFSKFEKIPVTFTGNNPPQPTLQFTDCNLPPLLLENIRLSRYTKPTPVQQYGMPALLAGRDVMVSAETGSGKTAAFLIPIVTKLLSSKYTKVINDIGKAVKPLVLIMAPTRELAIQIHDESRKFCYKTHLKSRVAYGGASLYDQISKIQEGCHILIATPGRLIDLFNRDIIDLGGVNFLVLDEADKMLDMGFEDQVRSIAEVLPGSEVRQTFMFSATFPTRIQKLASDYLKTDFLFLNIGKVGSACENIRQEILQVSFREKRRTVLKLLTSANRQRVLIFVKKKRDADSLDDFLYNEGLPCTSIHGDRNQQQREQALNDFKKGKTPILIATDVAARGLDIPEVSLVLIYDLGPSIQDYIHRIGRTGRAGNVGRSVAFFDSYDDALIAPKLVSVLEKSGQEVPEFLREEGGSSRGSYNELPSRDERYHNSRSSYQQDQGNSSARQPPRSNNYRSKNEDRENGYRSNNYDRERGGRESNYGSGSQGRYEGGDRNSYERRRQEGGDSNSYERKRQEGRENSYGGSSYRRNEDRYHQGSSSNYERQDRPYNSSSGREQREPRVERGNRSGIWDSSSGTSGRTREAKSGWGDNDRETRAW